MDEKIANETRVSKKAIALIVYYTRADEALQYAEKLDENDIIYEVGTFFEMCETINPVVLTRMAMGLGDIVGIEKNDIYKMSNSEVLTLSMIYLLNYEGSGSARKMLANYYHGFTDLIVD